MNFVEIESPNLKISLKSWFEMFKMVKTSKNHLNGAISATIDASTAINFNHRLNRIKNRNTALNQFLKNELCWNLVAEFKYITQKLIGNI